MIDQASGRVLRDVDVQGQRTLTRVRNRTLTGHSDGRAVPAVQSDSQPHAAPIGAAKSNAAQIGEEAPRIGYDEGFAQGLAQGRAQAEDEARRLAAQVQQHAAQELERRSEQLVQELGQQANKQAQAAYQARMQVLDRLIEGLPAQIQARLEAAKDDMLALCFEAICRVLGERAVQPESVRAQLAQAMHALRSRSLVAVHLHPDDLVALEQEADSMAGANSVPSRNDERAARWVGSTEVVLGGCILQSPEGGLDARLETQLEALRDLLTQTRAKTRVSARATQSAPTAGEPLT